MSSNHKLTLNKLKSSFNKQERKVIKDVKGLEKPFWQYTQRDITVIMAGMMFSSSIMGKWVNVWHWFTHGFDLSSYPPSSFVIYNLGTIAWLWVSIKQKNPTMFAIGLIGSVYGLIFSYGMLKTYGINILEWW